MGGKVGWEGLGFCVLPPFFFSQSCGDMKYVILKAECVIRNVNGYEVMKAFLSFLPPPFSVSRPTGSVVGRESKAILSFFGLAQGTL